MLEPLGLTPVAEAVYRTIITRAGWGVQDIADHLGVSKSEVKAALDLLVELALIGPGADVAEPLLPIDPVVGLSALLADAEAEAAQHRQRLDATRAAITVIASEAGRHGDGGSSVRLESVESVRFRLAELTAATTRECLSLNPNTAQTPDAKEASEPLNQQMLDRGVMLRCVYQDSFRNEPRLLAYAKRLSAHGGAMRTVPSVPLLMIIYDRSTVLVPLDPADTSRGALEVRSPGIVALACALFEQVWAVATPFGESASRDELGLDSIQRKLLALLADGHTDEFAARRLGISLTTVRRHMSIIMDRLNARSRFQAGVLAANSGSLQQL